MLDTCKPDLHTRVCIRALGTGRVDLYTCCHQDCCCKNKARFSSARRFLSSSALPSPAAAGLNDGLTPPVGLRLLTKADGLADERRSAAGLAAGLPDVVAPAPRAARDILSRSSDAPPADDQAS